MVCKFYSKLNLNATIYEIYGLMVGMVGDGCLLVGWLCWSCCAFLMHIRFRWVFAAVCRYDKCIFMLVCLCVLVSSLWPHQQKCENLFSLLKANICKFVLFSCFFFSFLTALVWHSWQKFVVFRHCFFVPSTSSHRMAASHATNKLSD